MGMVSINASPLAGFFHVGQYKQIELSNIGIHLIDQKSSSLKIPFEEVKSLAIKKGIIWNTFLLQLRDGHVYTLDGFKKSQTASFHLAFKDAFAQHYYLAQYKKAQQVLGIVPPQEQYFQTKLFNTLVESVKKEMGDFHFLAKKPDKKYEPVLQTIKELLSGISKLQIDHNNKFVVSEVEKYKQFFDTIEKNPLTQKQREAVVVNERANLVIAGAGSGKTSVMVVRVGYAMQKYGLSPEEILVVAFGNDAAKELKGRIEERLNLKDIDVSTFHAFGQNTIAMVEGKKPSLAPWVENANLKARLVEEILMELSERDKKFRKILLDFFSYPFAKYKSQFGFKTEIEYKKYMQENKIGALRGDPVKSYEESQIANFLFLNGITYEYEPFYKHDTATVEHRQYQPDFYLPDYDLYLEHFGVNRNGKTAPFVPNKPYLEGMEWKRNVHKENDTKLIETYSYYQQEGILLQKLEELLKENGVVFSPKSVHEALASLPDNTMISDFSKTLATFIGHYKSNDHTILKLRERAGKSERLNAFLDLFEPVLNAYETTKRAKKVIDFDDMISKAIDYIESGRYRSNYKCILVDEYQDISTARARLIKALYEQVDDSVLTVVGDDWQSIYRFAGSEISLFHDFEEYFGVSKQVKLDYTFRYNDKISSVSQKFIEANPNQIKKEIKTLTHVDTPTIHVWWGDDKDSSKIKEILFKVRSNKKKDGLSVFLLGRNRYSFPEDAKSIKDEYADLDIQYLTAHKSKGLEADIVIIPGVASGNLGFPSSIQGDPLLDLALAKEEDFDYAEERRLFYVAITRAKNEVHILASNTNVSPFARELEEKGYEVAHHYKDNIKPLPCPKCGLGTLVLRSGSYGQFWGCSSYGKIECDYTAPVYSCSKEGCQGVLQFDKDKGVYVCTQEGCGNTEKACPKCGGKLIKRFNKRQNNRPFYGCSNFGRLGCKYTENSF